MRGLPSRLESRNLTSKVQVIVNGTLATAPQWVGIIIGFVIGGLAECFGIANPESIIRLARWKDRLFIGCVTVVGAFAVLLLYGLYASGIDMHFALNRCMSSASASRVALRYRNRYIGLSAGNRMDGPRRGSA